MAQKKINLLLAPNAFKESMTAQRAAKIMAEGARASGLCGKIFEVPLSDGGDGLLDFFKGENNFKIIRAKAQNPLGVLVPSQYGILNKNTAVIEMALCSGLQQIPPLQRNALEASSFGLGQLILHAHKMGIQKFLVGIGGSASTDGGMGMLTALGARFYDSKRMLLPPSGRNLQHISQIDLSHLIAFKPGQIEVACDVSNPLYGKKGAAYVYGPQKGASSQDQAELDKGLRHFARLARKLNKDSNPQFPGAGAAGGTGFGILSFLKGRLKPGAQLILDSSNFSKYLRKTNLIITAEGALDGQSAFGKVPGLVCQMGKNTNIPVIALAGVLGKKWTDLHKLGLSAAFSIQPGPLTLEEAIKTGPQNLKMATMQVIATFAGGQK